MVHGPPSTLATEPMERLPSGPIFYKQKPQQTPFKKIKIKKNTKPKHKTESKRSLSEKVVKHTMEGARQERGRAGLEETRSRAG